MILRAPLSCVERLLQHHGRRVGLGAPAARLPDDDRSHDAPVRLDAQRAQAAHREVARRGHGWRSKAEVGLSVKCVCTRSIRAEYFMQKQCNAI